MAYVETTDLAGTGAGQGAAMVGFIQSGTGAVARTVNDKLRDVVSVTDFGAVGDGGTTDNTVAIQAALTRAGTLKCDLFIPATGTFYKITSTLNVPDGVRVYGAGHIKQTARGQNLFAAGHDNTFDGLRLEGDGLSGTGVSGTENIAIYAVGKRHLKVTNCVIHGHEGGGVFARNCFGVHVEGNLFYGNNWSGTAGGGSPSVADVSIYSNVGGGRCLIRGNQLYSNNSQNIFFSAVGLDQDAIIEGNICNTLDANFAEVANGGVKRHSIIAGYVNSQERRLIVRDNICRNTKQTGIYAYSNANLVTGPVLIEGNLCSNIGYDAAVSDLVGAVLVAPFGECPMIVRGNYSVDFKHTQGAAFTQVSGRAVIEGNVSVRSASRAVSVILNVDCSIVRGNLVRTSTGIDIWVELINANTNKGGIVIEYNDIERTTVAAMIRSILGTGYSGRCTIRNNQLKGAGADNNDANIGIVIQAPLPRHDIIGNRVSNVKWGVNAYSYVPAQRYHSEMRWDLNSFENCGTGGTGAAWGVGATSAAAVMPVEGNTYVNCTARHSGGTLVGWAATYDAQREGTALEVYGFTAKPTVGTWLAGDRVRFTAPAAGGSPGANCTALGTPGTWKHWAALEA